MIKIYQKKVVFGCGKVVTNEIACYEDDGKYYIRICKCDKLSRLYHEPVYHTFTKEFADKNHANNYFKKISKGYERVK